MCAGNLIYYHLKKYQITYLFGSVIVLRKGCQKGHPLLIQTTHGVHQWGSLDTLIGPLTSQPTNQQIQEPHGDPSKRPQKEIGIRKSYAQEGSIYNQNNNKPTKYQEYQQQVLIITIPTHNTPVTVHIPRLTRSSWVCCGPFHSSKHRAVCLGQIKI